MDLSDAQSAALAAIVAAAAAWCPRAGLEDDGHGPALDELEALGLVAPWRLEGHRVPAREPRPRKGWPPPPPPSVPWNMVTLTPWAAEMLGVVVLEFAEECPRWGRPEQEPETITSEGITIGPWRVGRLRYPERIPAPDARPEPETLKDEETGQPVALFQGAEAADGWRSAGFTIKRDRRMKAGRRR